jgi:hypothetical protein
VLLQIGGGFVGVPLEIHRLIICTIVHTVKSASLLEALEAEAIDR